MRQYRVQPAVVVLQRAGLVVTVRPLTLHQEGARHLRAAGSGRDGTGPDQDQDQDRGGDEGPAAEGGVLLALSAACTRLMSAVVVWR